MDSKCLELFLIPEYEIATEGIGSIVKRAVTVISGFINTIIKIFRSIINKLRNKKSKKTIEKANKFGAEMTVVAVHLRAIVNSIMNNFLYISNNKDLPEKFINEMKDKSDESFAIMDHYISKYDNSYNLITNKYRLNVISILDKNIELLEEYLQRANALANKGIDESRTNDTECLNLILKMLPKAQNSAIKLSNVLSKCEVID